MHGALDDALRFAVLEDATDESGSGTTEVTLREGATVLGSVTVDAAGTPTVWHFNLLAGGQAVGRQPSTGSRRYHHTDLLWSVRAVVTGATVVESTDYDPWGVVLAGRSLSSGTKEGYTGKARDVATGLDDFGARAYLSALGRWGGCGPGGGGDAGVESVCLCSEQPAGRHGRGWPAPVEQARQVGEGDLQGRRPRGGVRGQHPAGEDAGGPGGVGGGRRRGRRCSWRSRWSRRWTSAM